MKFGIIGCQHGHIAQFIDEMLAIPGTEFLGIVEDDPWLAESLSRRYDVPLLERREDLLNLGVELVGSSARNDLKADLICYCLGRGLHVMVDKPLVITLGDLGRVMSAVEGSRAQLGLMLTERFNPPIAHLKNLIDRGELGRIVHFTILKPHKIVASTRPPWHFVKSQNGGIIADLAIHDVDLLRWYLGCEVKSFHAYESQYTLLDKPAFSDNAEIFLIMENGATAFLRPDWLMPDAYPTWGDGRIFCVGTEGCAEIRTTGDPFAGTPGELIVTTNKSAPRKITPDPVGRNLAQDFIDRIEGRGICLLTHSEIFKSTETTLRIAEGAKRIEPSL
ncbi:MAG: Gfo/Idh/MocA family protein [bacterium]